MTIQKKKFVKGIIIKPDAVALDAINGEIKYDSADHKFKVTANSVAREIVDSSTAQALTNKTLDIDNNTLSNVEVDNLKSGVLNTSTTLATASDTQVPSALAVKTYVDDKIATVNDAAEIAFSNVASGLAATNVQAALDEIDGNADSLVSLSGVALDAVNLGTFTGVTIPDSQTNKQAFQALETAHEAHVNDTVDAHAASAITNTPSGNLAATTAQAALNELQGDIDTINGAGYVVGPASATADAISRYNSTTGKLVKNSLVTIDDAGVMSGATQLNVENLRLDANTLSSTDTNGNVDITPNGTGVVNVNKDARFFQDVAYQISTDSATGANATLTAPSTKIIRLTNASLTSLDGIPAGSQGQQVTIINATGNSVTINDNTGATAANRLLTGTKAALSLKDEASLIFEYDSTETRWMCIGGTGGGGSAGINYVSANPDFEAASTGYTAYADAAGVVPVDATNGSPVTTFVRSTSSPLRGTASGLWSKGAVNRQGEGFSYLIAIDTADQGKVLEVSYDYTTSTNFVDGDMRMFIYDVTNSVLIEPQQRDIRATSGNGKYKSFFQANSNSLSYRVAFHVATTSALAYDFKIDNVFVGPSIASGTGAIVTDWVAYTPTLTHASGGLTNGTITGDYSRVGDSLRIRGRIAFTGTTAAFNQLRFSLPAGLSIDTAKLLSSAFDSHVGTALIADTGTADYIGRVYYFSPTVLGIQHCSVSGTIIRTSNMNDTTPFAFGNTDIISWEAAIPIVGWSSGVQLASQGTNQVVAFQASMSATSYTSATTNKTPFNNAVVNAGGAFDTTNNRFVCPQSGSYRFSANLFFARNTGGTFMTDSNCWLYKNGSLHTILQKEGHGGANVFTTKASGGSIVVSAVKGDYFEIFHNASVTSGTYEVDVGSKFAGELILGNQTIGMDEVVAASYTTNAGQGINNGALTTVLVEDRNFDTHNAYNTSTGEYTIPVAGFYKMDCKFLFSLYNGWALGEEAYALIYVNGVQKAYYIYEFPASAGASIYISVSVGYQASLVKGDIITFRTLQNSGVSVALEADGNNNQMSIMKIK